MREPYTGEYGRANTKDLSEGLLRLELEALSSGHKEEAKLLCACADRMQTQEAELETARNGEPDRA